MRPLVLLLSLLSAVSSFADVKLRVVVPTSIDGLRSAWRVIVTNDTPAPMSAVSVYVWTDGSIVAMPVDVCVPSTGYKPTARCTVDLAANSSRTLDFTAQDPPGTSILQGGAQSGSVVDFDMTFVGRHYEVTSTDDSGPGTLRQAIEDVNRECGSQGCVIEFALDAVPAEGWFTIRPTSPLPPIEATFVAIDGGSQSRRTGETNPFGGPEIMLDGSLAGQGHGLFFSHGLARVADLAIGHFPGNGIESTAGGYFRRNYLGVDPSGHVAAPNGLRGLQVNGGSARVVDNVLSGNRRAGGFFWSDRDILVYGNFIGVGADGVTPLGNSAGLFFHKPAVSGWISHAFDNVIGYNAGMGIALSLEANADVADNVFRFNAGRPVDVGLDGATLDTTPGLPGHGGRLGAPVVLDARWDGTATIVTGRLAARPWSGLASEQMYIHAGSSPDATEEVVAITSGASGVFTENTFSVRVDKDLRGSFVRASAFAIFVYDWDHSAAGTSELSAPVAVEGQQVRLTRNESSDTSDFPQ